MLLSFWISIETEKRKNRLEEDEDEWRQREEKKHKIQHPTAANKSSFPEGVPLSLVLVCVCPVL
jgi:hypothetical protein